MTTREEHSAQDAENISSHQSFPPKPLETNGFGGRKSISGWDENVHFGQTNIQTDTQEVNTDSFFDVVESQLSKMPSHDTIEAKALNSFCKVFRKAENHLSVDVEKDLRLWLAEILRSGASTSTAKRYLSKLSSIYAENFGKLRASETFGPIREDLENLVEASKGAEYDRAVDTLRKLPSKIDWSSPDADVPAKFLLFSLYSWPTTISEVIGLKFNTLANPSDHQINILKSQQAPRRSYVFPLGQGRKRETQIRSEIAAGIGRTLGCKFGELDGFVGSLWIEAALRSRLSITEIVSIIPGIPSGYGWLKLVKREALSVELKDELTRRVAEYLNPSCPRWYAMHLRQNQTIAGVEAHIEEAKKQLNSPLSTFSPSRIIRKKVGKKMIKEETPLVPQIIFFKCRPETISPLFRLIGDYAWCFRTINRPDAPYAIIPTREMEAFQRYIGIMDDTMKVEFVQNTDLTLDRRIRITGGTFKGFEGTIYRKRVNPTQTIGTRVFQINICDEHKIIWQVIIPEEFIECLP